MRWYSQDRSRQLLGRETETQMSFVFVRRVRLPSWPLEVQASVDECVSRPVGVCPVYSPPTLMPAAPVDGAGGGPIEAMPGRAD